MNSAEALVAVATGERVTCDALPRGTVVKTEPHGWDRTGPRVVFEKTGDGFDLTDRLLSTADGMTWRKVEGWV